MCRLSGVVMQAIDAGIMPGLVLDICIVGIRGVYPPGSTSKCSIGAPAASPL